MERRTSNPFFAFLESGPGFVSTTVFIVCELYTFFSFPVEEEEEELYEYIRGVSSCVAAICGF
jgi:hypothetical protein